MEMVVQQRGSIGSATAAVASAPPPAKMKKQEDQDDEELRRGPWTVDEDLTLINYIAQHGDGRWNALARAAGLKRTGKSCRLRWLNYLRPDVKRGGFTADEQLLILDRHSRWGNRWSKIAQQLPGRTDNEIKNYWRTRVQKHARQLGCDVNSRRFKDAMTYLWMPRLAERAAATASQSQQPQQQHPVLVGAGNDDIASAACFAENDHSPGGSGSCLLPSSSLSSDSSSLTSTESSAAHLPNNNTNNNGCVDSCWPTTAMQDHEFWSNDGQFQEDLITGWVQGFSDGSLWSLDDIWRLH